MATSARNTATADLGACREFDLRRRDADDRVIDIVQADRFSDKVRVGVKGPAPLRVGQHDHPISAGTRRDQRGHCGTVTVLMVTV
jgi:hypothetical protein